MPLVKLCDIINFSNLFSVCFIEWQCRSLDNPPNGNFSIAWDQDVHVATYSCDDGFQINGPSERRCKGTDWTFSEPVCISDETVLGTNEPEPTDETVREFMVEILP